MVHLHHVLSVLPWALASLLLQLRALKPSDSKHADTPNGLTLRFDLIQDLRYRYDHVLESCKILVCFVDPSLPGKSVSVDHRANIYLGISFAIARGNSKLSKISDRSEVKMKKDTRCVWNTTWKHKIKQTPKIYIVCTVFSIFKMNIKSTRWISRIQDEYQEYKMNIKNTRWISRIQNEYQLRIQDDYQEYKMNIDQEHKMNIKNTRWISRIQDNITNTRWISIIQDEYQEYKMNIRKEWTRNADQSANVTDATSVMRPDTFYLIGSNPVTSL